MTMGSSSLYVYMNETSIESYLICSICRKPFLEPVCTSCDHIFCRECITRWIHMSNGACPVRRHHPLSIDSLTQPSAHLCMMLDRLLVQCTRCQQMGLQRGNFNNHTNAACPKTLVHCLAVDIKCPWVGPRHQAMNHTNMCVFQLLRPILSNLIAENEQLTNQIQHMDIQINQCNARVRQLTNKMDQMTDKLIQHQNLELEKRIAEVEARSSLLLDDQQLTDQDVKIVIEQAIINKQCTEIYFSHNGITPQGIAILASALNDNTTLKRLHLIDNNVSDTGARLLAKAFSAKNSALNTLDLSRNGITDEGIQSLAHMLKTNRTLTVLVLSNNQVTDSGVEMLANALTHHKTSLKELYLDSNKSMSDLSAKILIQMLQRNQSLRTLEVFDCHLSEKGKTSLNDVTKWKNQFQIVV